MRLERTWFIAISAATDNLFLFVCACRNRLPPNLVGWVRLLPLTLRALHSQKLRMTGTTCGPCDATGARESWTLFAESTTLSFAGYVPSGSLADSSLPAETASGPRALHSTALVSRESAAAWLPITVTRSRSTCRSPRPKTHSSSSATARSRSRSIQGTDEPHARGRQRAPARARSYACPT